MKNNVSMTSTLKSAIFVCNAYKATINSVYDEKRHAEMKRLINNEIDKANGLNNANPDDGILGRVIELYCRDSNSTLIKVRTQGKCDAYIPTTSGRRVKAEIKTRGGQIQELIKMSKRQQENTLIIYFNHTEIPTSKDDAPIRYYDCFKIMTVAEFLANAVFTKPRANGNINIQPTSKKMHKNLEQFEDFKRNKVYNF